MLILFNIYNFLFYSLALLPYFSAILYVFIYTHNLLENFTRSSSSYFFVTSCCMQKFLFTHRDLNPSTGQCALRVSVSDYPERAPVRRVGVPAAFPTVSCGVHRVPPYTTAALHLPCWWGWHTSGC